MRIETWNIILNAAIAGLLIAYGLWLRSIVRHQLTAKDSTIESLGAAIKANEAEIARLRGETAPAIAEAYARMKEFADRLAVESNDLAGRLRAAESETKQSGTSLSVPRIVSYVRGFQAASTIFGNRVTEAIEKARSHGLVVEDLVSTLMQIYQDFGGCAEQFTKEIQAAQDK